MFIEKLTTKDVREFLKENIKMEITDMKKINSQIYVKLDSDVEYIFSDFSCKGLTIFAQAGQSLVEPKWINFMSKKFKTEYNMARLKNEDNKSL